MYISKKRPGQVLWPFLRLQNLKTNGAPGERTLRRLHPQRTCYRGRRGGRAVSGRGRMRKRGPSGGGTLRRKSPQQGQMPSSLKARVASARSQWPRASHCGLMHCTVKPGKNCIAFPSAACAPCDASLMARPEYPWVTDGSCGALWREGPVVSREKSTRCRGGVASGVGTFDVTHRQKKKSEWHVVDDRGGRFWAFES